MAIWDHCPAAGSMLEFVFDQVCGSFCREKILKLTSKIGLKNIYIIFFGHIAKP